MSWLRNCEPAVLGYCLLFSSFASGTILEAQLLKTSLYACRKQLALRHNRARNQKKWFVGRWLATRINNRHCQFINSFAQMFNSFNDCCPKFWRSYCAFCPNQQRPCSSLAMKVWFSLLSYCSSSSTKLALLYLPAKIGVLCMCMVECTRVYVCLCFVGGCICACAKTTCVCICECN